MLAINDNAVHQLHRYRQQAGSYRICVVHKFSCGSDCSALRLVCEGDLRRGPARINPHPTRPRLDLLLQLTPQTQ